MIESSRTIAAGKVSMVMACYNSEPYLDKMLQSILAQNYDNIELITVNGSSTDGTSRKLDSYTERFAACGYELKNYELPDSNLVEALNEGLRHISGEFVCFPDSDDWMHPDFCFNLVSALQNNPEYGWAKCDAVLCDEDLNVMNYRLSKVIRPEIENAFIRFLADLDTVDAWIMMARSAYLEKALPNLVMPDAFSHEFALAVPMSFYGDFVHVSQILYYSIRHSGSGYYRAIKTYETATEYFNQYVLQFAKIFESLPIAKENNDAYFSAIRLRFLCEKYRVAFREALQSEMYPLLAEWREIAGGNLRVHSPADNDKYLYYLYVPACEAFMYKFLGIPLSAHAQELYNLLRNKPFAVYGGGQQCYELLPGLVAIGCVPKQIWDMAANQQSNISNIPLSKGASYFISGFRTDYVVNSLKEFQVNDIPVLNPDGCRTETVENAVILIRSHIRIPEIAMTLSAKGIKRTISTDGLCLTPADVACVAREGLRRMSVRVRIRRRHTGESVRQKRAVRQPINP